MKKGPAMEELTPPEVCLTQIHAAHISNTFYSLKAKDRPQHLWDILHDCNQPHCIAVTDG